MSVNHSPPVKLKNCGLDESAIRKMQPVGAILRGYFPGALRAVAAVAWVGNEKHNPGEPLHWARGKSDDHFEAEIRHALDGSGWDEILLPDGRKYAVLHAAEKAWRALAELQLLVEANNDEVIKVINHTPFPKTVTISVGTGPGGAKAQETRREHNPPGDESLGDGTVPTAQFQGRMASRRADASRGPGDGRFDPGPDPEADEAS